MNTQAGEEWTYRYLAAAFTWAADKQPALDRMGGGQHGTATGPPQPTPSIAEVRAWATANGLSVSDR